MADEPIFELRRLTTTELADLLARGPVVALVPAGSVEPHGPHLPLGTDTTLGEESCLRAASALAERGTAAMVASGAVRSGETAAVADAHSAQALADYANGTARFTFEEAMRR